MAITLPRGDFDIGEVVEPEDEDWRPEDDYIDTDLLRGAER